MRRFVALIVQQGGIYLTAFNVLLGNKLFERAYGFKTDCRCCHMNNDYSSKFRFYEGAASLADIVAAVADLGQDPTAACFICFRNEYYAVFYESMDHEMIVGQDKVFYIRNGRLDDVSAGDKM